MKPNCLSVFVCSFLIFVLFNIQTRKIKSEVNNIYIEQQNSARWVFNVLLFLPQSTSLHFDFTDRQRYFGWCASSTIHTRHKRRVQIHMFRAAHFFTLCAPDVEWVGKWCRQTFKTATAIVHKYIKKSWSNIKGYLVALSKLGNQSIIHGLISLSSLEHHRREQHTLFFLYAFSDFLRNMEHPREGGESGELLSVFFSSPFFDAPSSFACCRENRTAPHVMTWNRKMSFRSSQKSSRETRDEQPSSIKKLYGKSVELIRKNFVSCYFLISSVCWFWFFFFLRERAYAALNFWCSSVSRLSLWTCYVLHNTFFFLNPFALHDDTMNCRTDIVRLLSARHMKCSHQFDYWFLCFRKFSLHFFLPLDLCTHEKIAE